MADIFSDIFKFAGNALNQAITGDNLKDYKHASKLFVDDQYKRLPKFGFLFYVYFDINIDAARDDPANPNKNREIGMLVKSASLPKFNIDVKKYNAYNRPNFAQTKVQYDPLTFTFHDDSANIIRNFWFDYYNYYYRDADYTESMYGDREKYSSSRPTDKWGYSLRPTGTGTELPYLKSIRIYSLHQKQFSEYILMNPIIRSFKHGDHAQGQNDTMQHDMTVEYESVIYCYGSVTPDKVTGFIDLHYDKTPSPLTPAGGGTRSILGPGGLLETGDDVLANLADGNYGAALFKGLRGIQNARNMDLKSAAIGELLSIGTGVLRGNDLSSSIFVPSLSSLGADISTIGAKLGIGGGSGGSSWLAGAAGLGVAAFAGSSTRSQEMTDASNYIDDNYPGTPYDDFPSPTDDFVVEPGVSESTSMSVEASLSDGEPVVATNQESINSPGAKLAAQVQTQRIANAQLQNQASAHFAEKQLNRSQEAEAMFRNKYNEAVAQYGLDSPAAKNLDSLVNQEITKQSNNLQKINELAAQAASLDAAQSKQEIITGSTA